MKNGDLYKVKTGITKCSDIVNASDIMFALSLARIEKQIDEEIKCIEKAKKPMPDGYAEYLKKKEALNILYAVQKEDGTFQTLNGNLVIRNPNKYYSELEALNNEYKEAIDAIKKINEEFEKLMDSECPTKINTISSKLFPSTLNVEQVSLLLPIIE